MGLRRSGSWRMRGLISGTLSMLRMALVPARQAQRVFREVGEHKFLGDRRDTEQAGLSEVALHVVLLRVPEAPQGLHGAICCRSEEHTSELQSLMRISYAVFCLKKPTRTSYAHNIHKTHL